MSIKCSLTAKNGKFRQNFTVVRYIIARMPNVMSQSCLLQNAQLLLMLSTSASRYLTLSKA